MGRPPKDEYADDVAVKRLISGTPVESANRLERRLAAAWLLENRPDMSRGVMARRAGVSTKTLERLAVELGVPKAAVRYDADEMHARIAEKLAAHPKLTVHELRNALGGISPDTMIKYTRSAVEAGVIPPEMQRRNRVRVNHRVGR